MGSGFVPPPVQPLQFERILDNANSGLFDFLEPLDVKAINQIINTLSNYW